MSADDPRALMTFDLGPNRWPPDPAEGFALVTFSAEFELDPQKPHGKDDADIKGVGRKAREFTAELHWTSRIDSDARAYLLQVSPVGINQGKAWELVHPDQDLYNVDSVQLKTMGEIKRTPGERTCVVKGLSWAKKKPVQSGVGATTAAKPLEWVDSPPAASRITAITSDGNTIDLGPGPATATTSDGNTIGFNGAQAPKPAVP